MDSLRVYFIILISLLLCGSLAGQEYGAIVSGKVTDGTGEALYHVVVATKDQKTWSFSNQHGEFVLELSSGKQVLTFSRLGVQTKEIHLDLQSGEQKKLTVELLYKSLALEEVQVTAKENPNQLTSSSVINQDAIEHLQATDLGDIFQLLPGQVAFNPNLNSKSQASLRQNPNNHDAEKMNALGTAIILDGAPVSNNANMQVSNTSEIGAEGYFSTVAGGGPDLREIPTDQIEEVEVIRGIPSVQYGDLTSGAVIVKTKAGKTPFLGKLRLRSNTTQFYIGKGINLGKKNGFLNVDLDVANSQQDLRKAYPNFYRYQGNLTYSNSRIDDRWTTTTKLRFSTIRDNGDKDKDGAQEERSYSRDRGFRFTTFGKIALNNTQNHVLKYNFNLESKEQKGYRKRLYSGGGVKLFAFSDQDSTYESSFYPNEYYGATIIEGKPISSFASVSDLLFIEKKNWKHRIMMGVQWKMDVNYGRGRYFEEGDDLLIPGSQRLKEFREIPALHQLSVYGEDQITTSLFERELRVQAGLRFDNIQPKGIIDGKFGQTLLPRLNVAYYLSEKFSIRAGYGQTSKAPAMVYLYPDNAYFDAVSYQNYSANYPDENLLLITSKVIDCEPNDFKPVKNEKMECGFDWKIKENRISTTYYHEEITGGYGFKDVLAAVPNPVYDEFFYIPGLGMKPELDYNNVDTATYRNAYKIPVNTKRYDNHGVEFTFSSAKLKGFGTRFHFSGAWSKTVANDEANKIYISSQYFSGNREKLIGVYPTAGSKRERVSTNLRIIQHIPKLRFISTLSIGTVWMERYRSLRGDENPVGYYDKKGEYSSIESLSEGDFDFLIREYDYNAYRTVCKPPLWVFNLKITKEILDNMTLSFYSNNFFMSNPLFKNKKDGYIEKRNPDIYFGAELNFKI